MNKCHVCKDKVAEFKNRETGEELCEKCMNKEAEAAKAASMTAPTYQTIAIKAPAADESLEEAEVLDEDNSAPEEESPKEQNFNLRDVSPEIEAKPVCCIYCGKEGTAGDIVDNHGVRYAWHNLPADMTGDAEPEAVCLKCVRDQDKKHKNRFQRWFLRHRTLPVLPYTLMAKAEADKKRQALMDKARQWGRDHGIEEDTTRVCSVCGVHHGQLVETGTPYFHYLVLDVRTVVGKPKTRQDMAKVLLCRDCKREAIDQARAKGTRIQLCFIDEMEEELSRQERMAKVIAQGTEVRYEPHNQKGDGRRQKRGHDNWKTGTDNRG